MMRSCYFVSAGLGNHPAHAYYRGLGEKLAARGHRVLFLIGGQQKEAEDHESNPGIYVWPSVRPTRPADFLFLQRLVKDHRPSCLIASSGAVNVMMVVGWLMRVPCRSAWVHTLTCQIAMDTPPIPLWKATYQRLRTRMVYMLSTHIVPNSNATREDVSREYGVPARKYHVLPYLMQDPLKTKGSSGGSRERANTVVSVGRLYPSKGQDTLIKAVWLLREQMPRLQAEFIGQGPLYGHYTALAGRLGIGERCSFLGNLPYARVLARVGSAHVTVVASRAEAFGHVSVDSMSTGTAVIASNVGPIPEIIRDGVDGFLVPPDDPESLAAKLKILLSSAELRERMGRNGRERFLSEFELSRNIGRHADWFEQIVEDALEQKRRRYGSFTAEPKVSQ